VEQLWLMVPLVDCQLETLGYDEHLWTEMCPQFMMTSIFFFSVHVGLIFSNLYASTVWWFSFKISEALEASLVLVVSLRWSGQCHSSSVDPKWYSESLQCHSVVT